MAGVVRADARAGLPGRELRDRLRPQGVESGLRRGQALPAPGCAAAPRRGRRLGDEPWRLLGTQARRASRPQGHVDRLAAFARFCHCHRCSSVSWRRMCITMSAGAWERSHSVTKQELGNEHIPPYGPWEPGGNPVTLRSPLSTRMSPWKALFRCIYMAMRTARMGSIEHLFHILL